VFLATKNCVLKLAYNTQITSLKRNVQTIITPTLGGAYPFVRRSGEQKYRTFSISSLLSYEAEQFANNYYSQDLINALTLDSTDPFAGSLFVNLDTVIKDLDVSLYANLGHYDKWRVMEKLYRDMAIDFLYED
jgi:hypothetical protein